jgi:hypothetical protein
MMSNGAELILTSFSGADIVMIQGDKVVGELQAVTAKEISRKATYFTTSDDPAPIVKHIQGSLITSYMNTELWDGSKDFDIAAIWSERALLSEPKERAKLGTENWVMKKALMITGADIISEELYETPPVATPLSYIARTYIREIEDLDPLKKIVQYYK